MIHGGAAGNFAVTPLTPLLVAQQGLDRAPLVGVGPPQAVRGVSPDGVQHGERIRLKGLGVPRLQGSGRGDLWVHVNVTVPKKLTREQKKLFEQLRDTLPAENELHEKSLLEKVKDYFV